MCALSALFFGKKSIIPESEFTVCVKYVHHFMSVQYYGVLDIIGEGNGIPVQYSCLENPMDGKAW